MNSVVNEIKIVTYHEGWARGIAKMWNLSRDSWGGDTRVRTEEQIKTKEANSGNLELFLAVDGEEVVGYCSLSQYKEDTGSLYIPLLNVRPDYHGKKIGKLLVLKAVEKTIELGWPRLDLFTWPGNTKAVPLYKKCGFFWEERDDTTHLMNFIPTVVNTPLLAPVFSNIDWYEANIREIDVKPDGKKVNDFTFYEYEWSNHETTVKVQFERTSRGINFIETEDYKVELRLRDHILIEGQKEVFELFVENKKETPLTLKVKSNEHERIQCDVVKECFVETSTVITGELIVKAGEEPSVWKTHPYLSLTVSLDGLESEFRLGILPKQPAKLEANLHKNTCNLNDHVVMQLQIENNLNEPAEFFLTLADDELVHLDKKEYFIPLKEKERKLVAMPFQVKKHGYYHPTLSVLARTKVESELSFESTVGVPLKGFGEKFGGESKDYWHIYNGIYQVNVRKRDLLTSVGRNQEFEQSFFLLPPKVGKPYSSELSKIKPFDIQWKVEASCITLELVYESQDFKGVYFSLFTSLYGEGLVKRWAKLENKGNEHYENMYITQPVYQEMSNTYFPLKNRVVYFSEKKFLEYGDLKPGEITENWYFSNLDGYSIGFAWPKNSNGRAEDWQFLVENEVGELEQGASKTIDPVLFSIGAFTSWQEFREYVNEQASSSHVEASREKDFVLKNNDPIISQEQGNIHLTLDSVRTNFLEGQLQVYVNNKEVYQTTFKAEEEKTSLPISFLKEKYQQTISLVKGVLKEGSITTEVENIIIAPSQTEDLVSREENDVLLVRNGSVEFKVAPSFYPGLFSLSNNEHEWLDTSYPEIKAKGWWNPWAGGMKTVPSGLNTFSLLKELSEASFVNVIDCKGHSWSGIEIKTVVSNHTEWKGLTFSQYYLTLPGVPILAAFNKVINSGGKDLNKTKWITEMFVGGNELSDYMIHAGSKESIKEYQVGVEEHSLQLEIENFTSSKSAEMNMYFINSLGQPNYEVYMNKEAMEFISSQKALENSVGQWITNPTFILFDERVLSNQLLSKLRNIQF